MSQIKNILPKGKYNGMTIDGIEVKFKITLLDWQTIYCKWNYGEPFIFFLCFKLQIGLHYCRAWDD